MTEFRKFGEKYNASVNKIRELIIISIPVSSSLSVDVGFRRSGRHGPLLFPAYDLRSELYVYGAGAAELVAPLIEDADFCNILKHLLFEYAFAIEWGGGKLTARIDANSGWPHRDGTYGERFFVELQKIAKILEGIDSRGAELRRTLFNFGPVGLNKVLITTSFFAPLVVIALALVYFSNHLIGK